MILFLLYYVINDKAGDVPESAVMVSPEGQPGKDRLQASAWSGASGTFVSCFPVWQNDEKNHRACGSYYKEGEKDGLVPQAN